MQLGEIKPVLTALLLPPALPLWLMAWGVIRATRGKKSGAGLVGFGVVLLWLLSCNAIGVWLSGSLLPKVTAVPPAAVATVMATAQAIVVLGGGISAEAPEYGEAQPSPDAEARLRYGAWIARQTRLPLAFAGGVGWANQGEASPSEGDVSRRFLRGEYAMDLKWVDDRSRDTAENARQMKALLARDGVQRIALVTSAWHMPRAAQLFRDAGFTVVPAPTGFTVPMQRPLLEWLPSPSGLNASQRAIREWLALRLLMAQKTMSR